MSTRAQHYDAVSPNVTRPLRLNRKCACAANGESCSRCHADKTPIQRKTSTDAKPDNIPPIVNDVLMSPGRPLDSQARSYMEAHFGHDFSAVRIHTDARAAASARAIGALAYTVGRDIVFSVGQYSPRSSSGRKLLAHELAHASAGDKSVGNLKLGRSDSAAELIAERAEAMVPISASDIANAHRDEPPGTRFVRRQAAPATMSSSAFYGALSDQDYERAVSHLSEMNEGDSRTILAPLSYELRSRLRNAALMLPAAKATRVVSVIEGLEAGASTAKPGGEGASKSDTADAAPQQYVSVGLSYEVVGVIGGSAVTTDKIPAEVHASIASMFGATGTGSAPIALAVPNSGTSDLEQWSPGFVAAPGTGLPRFVDPLPSTGAQGGAGIYTRFIGPETGEGFFDLNRIKGNELAPRFSQQTVGKAAWQARMRAFEAFKRADILPSDLGELSKAIRLKGIAGLTTEEAALFTKVTRIHAQFTGTTEASPLVSLTEHAPSEALKKLPQVASNRAYVVRVQIDPKDVARVNEILKRAGKSVDGMAGELEVVVAQDLSAGGRGPGTAKILSIVANPAKGAPLGGWVGPAMKWGGRGLVFVGAALAVKDILTADGPHRRETQGRAFGSFAGGTVLGALGAGFCIGIGVVTAGVGILLCGIGFGVLGAVVGGATGGAIGRKFD
jgi:hypothetical protein